MIQLKSFVMRLDSLVLYRIMNCVLLLDGTLTSRLLRIKSLGFCTPLFVHNLIKSRDNES